MLPVPLWGCFQCTPLGGHSSISTSVTKETSPLCQEKSERKMHWISRPTEPSARALWMGGLKRNHSVSRLWAQSIAWSQLVAYLTPLGQKWSNPSNPTPKLVPFFHLYPVSKCLSPPYRTKGTKTLITGSYQVSFSSAPFSSRLNGYCQNYPWIP